MRINKIILSRKGFDSGTGGYPSPILPCGTMVSLPIPDTDSGIKYSELKLNESSYFSVMSDLKGNYLKHNGTKSELTEEAFCHLDPDLVYNLYPREDGWRGIFGQIDRAQSHLINQEVDEGDLFLFFGWFRKTIIKDGKLKFDPEDKLGRHIIYGYLQVGEIIQADDINKLKKWMEYHPHALDHRLQSNKNTLYIAKERFTLIPTMPGYGTFKYTSCRVLTKNDDLNRSHWELPKWMKDEGIQISCHKESSWKDDYFKSNARGQEFVIQGHDLVIDWAKRIVSESSD